MRATEFPRLPYRSLVALALLTGFIATPFALGAAEAAKPDQVFTDYLPAITPVTDAAGFTHPGVGLTKELLENVRAKVRGGVEPWQYYFHTMLLAAPEAARNVRSANSRDGQMPLADHLDSQGIQGRLVADAPKAYAQALLYYLTGDETYRRNAMMILRIWSRLDPAKCKPYVDCYIHAGIPLNRMVMAAEIMRYTSCRTEELAWTEKDTADFTANLVVPVTEVLLHDQNHFMNQHVYPLIGATAGYVFTGNRERYNEAVEWFTVNSTATDQGFNGAVKALFRWVTEEQKPGMIVGKGIPVEPHVQHQEMGRDQAHGGGDLTNAALMIRLLQAQATRLDPVAGTPSTAANAVDPVEFLDDRILAAADYFWKFMLGYDAGWTPQAYAITGGDPHNVGMGGTVRDTYNFLSTGYRGRYGNANFWDFYAYYTYVKKQDVAALAPYYHEAFTKKPMSGQYDWRGKDGGTDFWLYLPPEAAADAGKFIPTSRSTSTVYEVEERYTNLTRLDPNKPAVKANRNRNAIKETNNIDASAVVTVNEGDTSVVRFHVRDAGARMVYFSSGLGRSNVGFRIRTNGPARLESMGQSRSLPDTKGEWKYFPMVGQVGDFCEITLKGASGIVVDLDHLNTDKLLVPPTFKNGNSDLTVYAYAGGTLNLDFAATAATNLSYALQNNPEGSTIASDSGAFFWKPAKSGVYSLLVTVSDGKCIDTRNVTVIVAENRAAAVQTVTSPYREQLVYESETLNNYRQTYADTIRQIETASEADFDRQLQKLRLATEGLRLTTPLLPLDGSLRWSSVAVWSSWGEAAGNMDDGSHMTGAWYGLALGSAPDTLHHIIDFGPDYKVSATKFGFQSNIFADRIANSIVCASNDRENWVRLTPDVTQLTQDYQTLEVDPAYRTEKYRYFKLQMIRPLPDVLYGMYRNLLELSEFRIYGTRWEIGNKIRAVAFAAAPEARGVVSPGATIRLQITGKEPLADLKVTIQGQDAKVATNDRINWTAEVIADAQMPVGPVGFSLNYRRADGTPGDPTYIPTDNARPTLVQGHFIDVAKLAAVTASDRQYPGNGLSKEEVARLLFDGRTATFGDLNSPLAYYTVDFWEAASVSVQTVLLLPRETAPERMNGLVVQGSNDNASWADLTTAVSGSRAKVWTVLAGDRIRDRGAYRFLRLYNTAPWSGNLAEVAFYGEYGKK